MKSSAKISNQKSPWQAERAAALHRACRSVEYRINHGEKPRRAFRRVATYHNGRRFKCDTKRRMKLAESTLRRLFSQWKRCGEVPSAFRLNYVTRASVFTAPMLIRFVNWLVTNPQPSLKKAWQKFARRGGNFGPGRRAGRPLKISAYQVRYAFPAANFRLLREQQRIVEAAQARLSDLQQQFIAEITERFPERSPRRPYVRRGSDFQI